MSIARTERPEAIYELYDWLGDVQDQAATQGESPYFDKLISEIRQKIAEAEAAWQKQQEAERKATLLDLALAQAKSQWYSGEAIWLWRHGNQGAFLKNDDCFITLNLTGYARRLIIFKLDLYASEWKVNDNLDKQYQAWAKEYQRASAGL